MNIFGNTWDNVNGKLTFVFNYQAFVNVITSAFPALTRLNVFCERLFLPFPSSVILVRSALLSSVSYEHHVRHKPEKTGECEGLP